MELSDNDKKLQEKLAILRGDDRENRNLTPSIPPPLPLELQSELKIAVELLKLLFKTESKPFIFSPSTISEALGSLIGGVEEEETEKKIEKILSKDIVYDKEYFKDLLYSNRIFYSKNTTLLASAEFEDQFQSIDFSDKIKATEKINNFISSDTNKMISKLIEPSDISKDISTCLGIAATFEAKFDHPFDEQKPSLFYSNPPRTIDMLLQKNEDSWFYTKGEDWTCLGIPYKNHDRRLYIILPKEMNGLSYLIQKFDSSLIEKCILGGPYEVNAAIPVFEIESKIILNEPLKEMGFAKLFENGSLSKIFSNNNGLDLAIHSSKIQVDRYGTFVQPFGNCRDSLLMPYINVDFIADHPFIFFIADFESFKFKSLHFIGTFS